MHTAQRDGHLRSGPGSEVEQSHGVQELGKGRQESVEVRWVDSWYLPPSTFT